MRICGIGDRRNYMDLHLKDIVELKKIHPCGSKQWEITRVGMDIKLSKVERSIKKILPHTEGTEGGTLR